MDRDAIDHFLREQGEPVWESSLLAAGWPHEDQSAWTAIQLYQNHFALFAYLYGRVDEYAREGLHLHVHFMGTFLETLPPEDHCRCLIRDAHRLCGVPLPCPHHGTGVLPDLADARAFYTDQANIGRFDETEAECILRGGWHAVAVWPYLEEAWKVLGLPAGTGLARVTERYRELAKATHPDTGARSEPDGDTWESQPCFTEVHAAYHRLRITLPQLIDTGLGLDES